MTEIDEFIEISAVENPVNPSCIIDRSQFEEVDE